MRPPEDCRSLEDVREAINFLDRQIIGLIGKRALYVKAAARFKTGEESVRAPNARRKCSKSAAGWPKKKTWTQT